MRRDEDPNRPGQAPAEESAGDGDSSPESDAGGESDQEAMEPDLGNTG